MVLVPDKTRKIPLSEISFSEYTLSDLFELTLNIKRAISTGWTDESPSDLGMQLVSIFSSLTDLMNKTVNQAATNTFLMTATLREQVKVLCRQLQYVISEGQAAVVTARFALSAGHPQFTIPAATKIATAEAETSGAIIFETNQDQVVASGLTTIDVACTEGETILNERIGSSRGTADQQFFFLRRPVVWQSELVEVFDGVNWVVWSRVADFVDSDSNDNHYTIETDESGYMYVIFGDGVFGTIPPLGTNNIRASYRLGSGSRGNVGIGEISEILSPLQYVDSVMNPQPATGGMDQESLPYARRNAIAQWRTIDRFVTASDVQTLLRNFTSDNYGSIAHAVAVGVDNLTIDVRFVPVIGGVPAQAFKNEVKAYLDERRMAITEVEVIDPLFLNVDYDVTIWLQDGYLVSQVVEGVRQAIVKFGSPTYRDPDGFFPNGFGLTVSLSKLYRALHDVAGIDRALVTLPAADLTMPNYQIREISTIDIIANQGGSQSSYLNLSTEL